MRSRLRGRRRSVRPGARAGRVFSRERNFLRGADAVRRGGRLHLARRYRETRRDPARSETPCTYGNTSHENREVPWSPVAMAAAGRVGKSRTHADDERPREVGQAGSTDEVLEQRRATGRGGDGGKRSGQREPAPAKRAPDSEPERRAECAGAGTASGNTGQEAAVHGAPAPHLRHQPTADGLSRPEARGRAGRGWRDVAALRRDVGRPPPRPVRTAETRGVPSEAGSSGVHLEGRRAAAAARRARAGRQNRSACHRRGAQRHLRVGLSRLLVRVSAGRAASITRWTRSTRDC